MVLLRSAFTGHSSGSMAWRRRGSPAGNSSPGCASASARPGGATGRRAKRRTRGSTSAASGPLQGRSVPLGPGVRVPALWAGTVVAVVPDFLGRSVFVAHDRQDGEGRRLHSVYGHLEPGPGLAPGSLLREGGEVGAIADPAARKSSVPAHLHLTVAWIAVGARGTLDWSVLRDPARTVLIDPLPLVCATMPSSSISVDESDVGWRERVQMQGARRSGD